MTAKLHVIDLGHEWDRPDPCRNQDDIKPKKKLKSLSIFCLILTVFFLIFRLIHIRARIDTTPCCHHTTIYPFNKEISDGLFDFDDQDQDISFNNKQYSQKSTFQQEEIENELNQQLDGFIKQVENEMFSNKKELSESKLIQILRPPIEFGYGQPRPHGSTIVI